MVPSTLQPPAIAVDIQKLQHFNTSSLKQMTKTLQHGMTRKQRQRIQLRLGHVLLNNSVLNSRTHKEPGSGLDVLSTSFIGS